MIYGPHLSYINRLHPIDKDRQEEQQDPSKKKKVLYHGRSWEEKEEELPVQPKKQDDSHPRKRTTVMYADKVLLDKAKKLFDAMTTLEEKCAQLLLLEAEAVYDTAQQREAELMLQAWQVGGVLFKKGDYRRQMYLIEHYQGISKTPLLIANDFLHGLSFYLQGDSLKCGLSNQHFRDLGKAVMAQNRRMGVHVQLDRERKGQKTELSEAQAKSFRKGIREAQGIVGKQKSEKITDDFSQTFKSVLPYFPSKDSVLVPPHLTDANIQESVGYKVLTIFDLSVEGPLDEFILSAYREHYDIFLVSKDFATDAIRALCKLVTSSKISEDDLDRRVMRILIIKALFSK